GTLCVGPEIPLDRHEVERGFCPPPGIGNHRHRGMPVFPAARSVIAILPWTFSLDDNRGMDTGTVLDGVEIVTLELAPEDWTGLDGSVEHARQLHVDAVDGLARHLERDIPVFLLGPDQRELIWPFDLDLRRIGQLDLRSPCGNLSISRAPSSR